MNVSLPDPAFYKHQPMCQPVVYPVSSPLAPLVPPQKDFGSLPKRRKQLSYSKLAIFKGKKNNIWKSQLR